MEKLRRAKKGRKLTGVCAGLAYALCLDVSYVRLAWLAMAVVPPFNHLVVVAIYVILSMVVPVASLHVDKEPEPLFEVEGEANA